MPSYPYLYNINNQNLYSPIQTNSSGGLSTNRPIWTTGPQPVIHPAGEQTIEWTKFGAGIGALALAGRMQIRPGYRGFDLYSDIIKRIEEYSPGRVFRTFQVSHMLSVLETPSLQTRYFSPELISEFRGTQVGQGWIDHLSRLAGRNMAASEIATRGFRFEGGQLRLGRSGGEVLLKHAGVITSPMGAMPSFQMAYARSVKGGPLFEAPAVKPPGFNYAEYEARKARQLFSSKIKYLDEAGKLREEVFMFTGGQSRFRSAGRFLAGYGTSLAERINQLARAPFEMEPIASAIKKTPLLNRLNLGVVPSSGLKTIGKITGKLGILGYASYLAYQQLDYYARKSSLLDNTLFGEGITAGFASLWTRSQLALSKASDYLGFQDYREWQEGIAPGSTDLQKLLAFPLMGAIGAMSYGYGTRLYRQRAFRKVGLDLAQASVAASARDEFFRAAVYGGEISEHISRVADPKTLQLLREQTEKLVGGWEGKIAKSIATKQESGGAVGFLSRVLGKMSPSRMRILAGAGLGLGLIAPFLPGALVPSERPEELERIYSGEQLVAIRKGRWWEAGRQPFEGNRISYYAPHWYPRMLQRAKEKSIYGEEEPSPFEKFYLDNFTYEIEKKKYYERPYPVTGQAFENIPFLGPLLSATIGRLIKPARLMHTEEWMRSGSPGQGIGSQESMDNLSQENQYLAMPPAFGETVAPGELGPGAPISPYGLKGTIGEQLNKLQQMIGLPGFTMSAIKEQITGRPDVFGQEMQLESAGRITSPSRGFYDLEVGGLLGGTELFRRMVTKERNIQRYNPLRNQMPQWMPGPGERSEDFLHGNPFTKVQRGEERLPGVGYAARFPELEGVAPSDYPLIHRFAILGDLAPYTDKFKQAQHKVQAAITKRQLSAEDTQMYKDVMEQVRARKIKKVFDPYKYKDRKRTPIEELLTMANQDEKQKTEPSWFEKTVGSYWETLAHGAETPFEFLTPISPASKLIHMRTAVEDYERTQLYGTSNAFWGHPIRDFFGPFFDSARHALGWEGIPEHVKDQRSLESYFDILKYVKFTKLKRQAQADRDTESVKEFEQKRRETLFGINPYTYNYSHIFRSLPRRERDYFNEFIQADMEERKQIFDMIPDNERALYIARWKMEDVNDLKEAIKKGLLNEKQLEQSEQLLEQLYQEKETEGFPKTQELWTEYLKTRLKGESYPDWYRRTQLLEQLAVKLPGPDFVGWHPAVELDDIKMKIVENEGRNAFDYDLWPDRARRIARRPIINEAAQQLTDLLQEPPLSSKETRNRIDQVLDANNLRNAHVEILPGFGLAGNEVNLEVSEDRTHDIINIYRQEGLIN